MSAGVSHARTVGAYESRTCPSPDAGLGTGGRATSVRNAPDPNGDVGTSQIGHSLGCDPQRCEQRGGLCLTYVKGRQDTLVEQRLLSSACRGTRREQPGNGLVTQVRWGEHPAVSPLVSGQLRPTNTRPGAPQTAGDLLPFAPGYHGMPSTKPLVRGRLQWWQVLGSNQRRRCRQIYRPPDNLALTRRNTTSQRFQGPYRDRTPVSNRTPSASAGSHPDRLPPAQDREAGVGAAG